jgi:hypothetical protein
MTVVTLRIHRRIILASLLFAAVPSVLPGQVLASQRPAAPRIPAISGTVVDAFTGKPVGGVDVVLRASLGGDGGGPLRYENNTTSADGRFRFPASPEPRAAGPLSKISELSLSVNRVFVSVAQMRAMNPRETSRTSDGPSDVTWLAQHGTIADFSFANNPSAEIQFGRLDNRFYFPVSVQFLRDCAHEWAATCISVSPNGSVRIPLIPVLNDPARCDQIADSETRERCRQLYTYRAAFIRRETIAQVREDKKLCESVDHGRVSQQCLTQLHNDVRLRASPRGSLRPPPGLDSPENVLILTPVTGLVAGTPSLDYADLFEETAIYAVRYASATERFGGDPISAVVDIFSEKPTSKDLAARMAQHGGFPPGFEKGETIDGSPVTTLERGTASIVAWTSTRRIVKLEFERSGGIPRLDHAITAAAAGWTELIRAYLRKYPSSN